MSYTNGTTHYNLPQTVGTDKRDWSDTNQAFQDIDAALYQAVQDTAQAELDIDALEVRMNTAEQNIADNAGDISALDGRLTTAEGTITQHTAQIADVRQDAEDMICAYNEATATSTHAYAVGDYFIYNDVLYRAIQAIAIGDTIVPDTNCTTTNVTTEIASLKSRVVASVTADGAKTFRAVATELLASLVMYNLDKEYLLTIKTPLNDQATHYHARAVTSNSATFEATFIASNQFSMREMIIGNNPRYTSVVTTVGAYEWSFSDGTDNVIPSGTVYKITELSTI